MKEKKKKERDIPPTEPKKPLQLESSMKKLSFVAFKILGSAFISEIAASMAGFAALPMTESKVKTAAMFMIEGNWQ